MAACPNFIEYITWFALLCCASGILYEVYEKYVEYRILSQIENLSDQLLKIVPEKLLDIAPSGFTEALQNWSAKHSSERLDEPTLPPH